MKDVTKARARRAATAAFAVFLTGVGICFALMIDSPVFLSRASLTAPDNAARRACLESYGWQVGAEPCEVYDIAVPAEFDEVYLRYNELQQAQGFDLVPLRGRVVRRYVYEVLNYPGAQSEVRAGMLVYKDTVVAGEVFSVALDGFMHGLDYRPPAC